MKSLNRLKTGQRTSKTIILQCISVKAQSKLYVILVLNVFRASLSGENEILDEGLFLTRHDALKYGNKIAGI